MEVIASRERSIRSPVCSNQVPLVLLADVQALLLTLTLDRDGMKRKIKHEGSVTCKIHQRCPFTGIARAKYYKMQVPQDR